MANNDQQEEVKKVFLPADWIAAGYTRFESNKDMNPSESFFVQKRIRDESTGSTRYFITVGVYDYDEIKVKIPYRWGFSPSVQFTRDVTMNVTLHTFDPAVAEAEFHALWLALGQPCYD